MKLLNRDLDRFEDFKELDVDGSDEDVFFYPEPVRDPPPQFQPPPQLHNPYNQPSVAAPTVVSSFKLEPVYIQPAMFSPFDIK